MALVGSVDWPEARDRHAEVGQEWRLKSIVVEQCRHQGEGLIGPPIHLDLAPLPVDDPILANTLARVEIQLQLVVPAMARWHQRQDFYHQLRRDDEVAVLV